MAGTRDRLVAATNELYRRKGYHASSLKEVTSAADATVGSLYHFFPRGKAELAEAVLTESGAAYQALFEVIADEAAGPAEAVGDFFAGAADVLADSDYLDVCPIGTVAREVASTDDALRDAADRVFRSWTAAAAARFEQAGIDEERSRDLATTVIAALEGGFILARTRRDDELLRAIGRQMQDLVAGELADVGQAADRAAR